jgi:2'-aminobiphenyl-2,3-diol 1,2-dioxygenase large subunit
MKEIGRQAQALKPDALVVISSDHMFNINLRIQPPFTVGIGDEYVPFGDMGLERRTLPGDRVLAEAWVARAANEGFDLAVAEDYHPDHGIALPLMFLDPKGDIPIVPLLVNINMKPLPRPSRCFALAQVLRETIQDDLPRDRRVVVVGTGGLSHWLNIPGHGQVNTAFDQNIINLITSGRAEELASLSVDEILQAGGNGGMEILNWIMAAATLPGKKGHQIYYEAMPQWFTGMGGVALAA